ncbi:MAG: sulfite exporter TauE/SafE family protein [Gammaproteobacteria bacterium]|nr:sulfite exporter TauE/SafE family protein [Gammaproteobacteria bacterium]
MKLLVKIPELSILLLATLGCYALAVYMVPAAAAPYATTSVMGIVVGSFVLSFIIAIVAVVAGIGGGVIFTPIVLGFTSIDTMIVRATGLVVAMFSGLISAAPLLRQGLVDIRLVYVCALPTVMGGVLGAWVAIEVEHAMGPQSDALVRLLLGLMLLGVAYVFLSGGGRNDYPKMGEAKGLGKYLGLQFSYFETSLNRTVSYQVVRLGLAMGLFLWVGFMGGFFGLGGGWAMVPVLNLVMAVPLKAAAASSGVLLALGNAAAIWPYIVYGALVPLLVAPWMLGQVTGGIFGAYLLSRVKVAVVRRLLILMLCLTSIKLIHRGLQGFGVLP